MIPSINDTVFGPDDNDEDHDEGNHSLTTHHIISHHVAATRSAASGDLYHIHTARK